MFTRIAFLALAMAAASPVLLAQAGKIVTSRNGVCQVTVPASWSVSGTFGIANSPNNKVNLAVTSPLQITSLDEAKRNAPTLYPDDKVVKSTPAEFQMEGLSMNNKPNVYRAIQLAGKVCIVEVIYESGTVADARAIAESLKSAK